MTPTFRRLSRSRLLAVALLAAGLAVAAICASARYSSVHRIEQSTFRSAASEVSETAQTLLRRNGDFVSTLDAVMTMKPHLSQQAFDAWYTELEGRQRQVGSLGTTIVSSVPARQLRSFLARRNVEPAFRALVGGAVLPVVPDGGSRYCLIATSERVIGSITPKNSRLIQEDWCQPSSEIGRTQTPLMRAAARTGQLLTFPVATQGLHTVFAELAFYRAGAPLQTPAQRAAAVSGWVVSSFDNGSLLNLALGSHAGLGISLFHSNPGSRPELVGHAGTEGQGASYFQSTNASIDGPWSVLVRGTVPAGGLSAGSQGLIVLVSGALMSLLIAALVLALTRSREGALQLVREKTVELREQALHDALTGLPNRVLAMDRAAQMLARARREDMPVAALYVDVDGFKHINDTFGHTAGDEVLRAVADRLLGVIREGDTAARLGGDEFLVLLEGRTLDGGPELVADRLLLAMRQPIEMREGRERPLSITVSIGVASGERTSADELIRDADLALYVAKAAGRDRVTSFRSSMQEVAHERLTLEMDLKRALEREELFLLYQPIFDLETVSITGVEALIRWQHPARGTLGAEDFIPVAEESGLIVPIGRWVLAQASRQAAAWRAAGHAIEVAVNVSARQLESDHLISDVKEALDSSGLEGEALTLELTETTMMVDAAATAFLLGRLKHLGVGVAIDDFGTGYSSLAYLSRFPADVLKIDRSFVSEVATSEQSRALVHTLVLLGRTLGLQTLAEGIEDHDQLQALRQEGCELGQGYLFSRPLDPAAMTALLIEQELRSSSPSGPLAQSSGVV